MCVCALHLFSLWMQFANQTATSFAVLCKIPRDKLSTWRSVHDIIGNKLQPLSVYECTVSLSQPRASKRAFTNQWEISQWLFPSFFNPVNVINTQGVVQMKQLKSLVERAKFLFGISNKKTNIKPTGRLYLYTKHVLFCFLNSNLYYYITKKKSLPVPGNGERGWYTLHRWAAAHLNQSC